MALPTQDELRALNDNQLETLHADVVVELHRRTEITTLPTDIDAMIQRFIDYGGDVSKLKNPNSYTKK